MNNSANTLNDLSFEQVANFIQTVGPLGQTVLVQGETGIGKSAILKRLEQTMPTHVPVYFDMTTKDAGDVALPKLGHLDDESAALECVRFVVNEELGVHLGRPVVLMFDEYGKGVRPVQNAVTRIMHEGKIGSYTLPEGSVVFLTTNFAEEGLGDVMAAHQYNRITALTMRKPTADEWLVYAMNTGRVDHALMAWVKENPHCLQSYREVQHPNDNRMIHHPREQRVHFVTPRSLDNAGSIILPNRHLIDRQTLTAALCGTVGAEAAHEIVTYVDMADKLVKLSEIKADPHNARLPEGAAALCMVVFRTLALIDRSWMDEWMVYLRRLPREAQSIFINSTQTRGYPKQNAVMTHKGYNDMVRDYGYLFRGDDT